MSMPKNNLVSVSCQKGIKLQQSKPSQFGSNGKATFDDTLQFSQTVYKDDKGMHPVEFEIIISSLIQSGNQQKRKTIAKTLVDLAQFCSIDEEEPPQKLTLELSPKGQLYLTVQTKWLKNFTSQDTPDDDDAGSIAMSNSNDDVSDQDVNENDMSDLSKAVNSNKTPSGDLDEPKFSYNYEKSKPQSQAKPQSKPQVQAKTQPKDQDEATFSFDYEKPKPQAQSQNKQQQLPPSKYTSPISAQRNRNQNQNQAPPSKAQQEDQNPFDKILAKAGPNNQIIVEDAYSNPFDDQGNTGSIVSRNNQNNMNNKQQPSRKASRPSRDESNPFDNVQDDSNPFDKKSGGTRQGPGGGGGDNNPFDQGERSGRSRPGSRPSSREDASFHQQYQQLQDTQQQEKQAQRQQQQLRQQQQQHQQRQQDQEARQQRRQQAIVNDNGQQKIQQQINNVQDRALRHLAREISTETSSTALRAKLLELLTRVDGQQAQIKAQQKQGQDDGMGEVMEQLVQTKIDLAQAEYDNLQLQGKLFRENEKRRNLMTLLTSVESQRDSLLEQQMQMQEQKDRNPLHKIMEESRQSYAKFKLQASQQLQPNHSIKNNESNSKLDSVPSQASTNDENNPFSQNGNQNNQQYVQQERHKPSLNIQEQYKNVQKVLSPKDLAQRFSNKGTPQSMPVDDGNPFGAPTQQQQQVKPKFKFSDNYPVQNQSNKQKPSQFFNPF